MLYMAIIFSRVPSVESSERWRLVLTVSGCEEPARTVVPRLLVKISVTVQGKDYDARTC